MAQTHVDRTERLACKHMNKWYKSGLEGYCKAAAELMGEPSNAEAWGRFCNDFLRDRDVTKPDIASRTWSMSRDRQGKSNRLMKFEVAWLGYHANEYAKKSVSKSLDENERLVLKRRAIAECEAAAIRTCVDALIEDGGEIYALSTDPSITPSFAVRFHSSIVPAIERGFTSEGYSASDIRNYTYVLDELSNRNLHDSSSLRDFCEALTAGLIYGPSHPIALNRPYESTDYFVADEARETVPDNYLRVTQLFSDDFSAVGYSEVYGKDDVVFFGRCTEVEEYLARCRLLYGSDNGDFIYALEIGNAKLFPVSGKHSYTGNTHGAIAYVGEGWFYYDLGSTNGTSCTAAQGMAAGNATMNVDGLMRISGGERLRMGAPVDSAGEMLYRGATTVLVSFCVDEGEDF